MSLLLRLCLKIQLLLTTALFTDGEYSHALENQQQNKLSEVILGSGDIRSSNDCIPGHIELTPLRLLTREQEPMFVASIPTCKTRAILTAEQAIEIFKMKLSSQPAVRIKNLSACKVAFAYGVSEKTVRDIWKGRTWLRETMHFDPAHIVMAARRRPPGRPRLHPQSNNPTVHPVINIMRRKSKLNVAAGSNQIASGLLTDPSALVSQVAQKMPSIMDEVRRTDSANSFNGFPLLLIGSHPWPAADVPQLPESSCANDPFHDDWRY